MRHLYMEGVRNIFAVVSLPTSDTPCHNNYTLHSFIQHQHEKDGSNLIIILQSPSSLQPLPSHPPVVFFPSP